MAVDSSMDGNHNFQYLDGHGCCCPESELEHPGRFADQSREAGWPGDLLENE